LKYEDGPSIEVDVLIDAPIERVWQLVCDINVPAEFSTEFLGAVWLDETPCVGARFRGRNHHAALGEWETTSFVSRYELLRAFGWVVTDSESPSSSWWFELEQEPEGVRLRQGTRMGPAASGLTIAITAMPEKEERIIARRLAEYETNMRATVDGIKGLAEAAQ
jgi:hypothetical protein